MTVDLPARGAYGIAVAGPLADHPALREVATPCGHLTLTEHPARDSQALIVSPGHVQILLADDSCLEAVDAGGGVYRASLAGGPLRSSDDLVHPYLAPIAALVHRWRGVPALHGAALGSIHGAIALLGERESGKSTTAAALVASGLSLLSDDLVVVDQGRVRPGPLSVDLRPTGAELLGLSGDRVRGGQRLRHLASELVGPPESSQLGVLVHLQFGPATRVREIPISQRLPALASQLYWPGVGSPARDLLALTALPQVVLERPRGAIGLNEAVNSIMLLLRKYSRKNIGDNHDRI